MVKGTATKTWKIGENAKGGVITVEIKNCIISVIGKEWDFSTGSSKGSDQSKAKEFSRKVIPANDGRAEYKLFEELSDLTTSYYADEIIKWIKSKVTLTNCISW